MFTTADVYNSDYKPALQAFFTTATYVDKIHFPKKRKIMF